MIFSVAPTLGRVRVISAPRSAAPPVQRRRPPRCSIPAPSFRSADRWRSMGRGPSSQPPGILTSASPVRARMAPRKMIEERISRMSASGTSERLRQDASTVTVVPSRVTRQPRWRRIGDRSLHIAEAGAVVQDADSVGQRGSAEQGQDAVFRAVDHHLARQTPPAVDLVIFHGTSSDFRTFAPSYAEEVQGCECGDSILFLFHQCAQRLVDTLVGVTDGHFPQSLLHFLQLRPERPAGAARCHRADRRRRPSPASAPPRPCR